MASLLCCTKPPRVPMKIAYEPWTSHASFLFSCVMLSKKRTSLRPRPITFVSVPLLRRTGWCAFTVKSSRRFFRGKGVNGHTREESEQERACREPVTQLVEETGRRLTDTQGDHRVPALAGKNACPG